MNLLEHPIHQLLEITKNMDDAVLHFSVYSYRPQELLDERDCLDVKVQNFSEEWLLQIHESLGPNKELACHSKLLVGNKTKHIPMIDFCCSVEKLDEAKTELAKLLPNYIFASLKYYSTGRSMHAYGYSLLSPKEWCQMMGRLLLANLPDKQPLIDSRWIGHRILAGYSALRLSCNTDNYLSLPNLVR